MDKKNLNVSDSVFHIEIEGGRKNLHEATIDELLSARASAWRDYFESKPDHDRNADWGESRQQRAKADEIFIESLGIREVESEIRDRGVGPKSKDFNRVYAYINR